MSAVSWTVTPLAEPGRLGPAERHLHLVPPMLEPAPRRSVRLRLTPRGRLVLLLLLSSLLALAAPMAWSAVTGGGAAAGAPSSVVVQADQTLSGIAASQLPGMPMADAVVLIRQANNLPSAHVHAGQVLTIPAG